MLLDDGSLVTELHGVFDFFVSAGDFEAMALGNCEHVEGKVAEVIPEVIDEFD